MAAVGWVGARSSSPSFFLTPRAQVHSAAANHHLVAMATKWRANRVRA